VAGGDVVVTGGRGAVIGGVLMAAGDLRVRVLGSPSETPTRVMVGMREGVQDRLRGIDERLARLRVLLAEIDAVIAARAEEDQADERREQENEELRLDSLMLQEDLERSLHRREEIVAEQVEPTPQAAVHVLERAFGRVSIHIGPIEERLDNAVAACCFVMDPRKKVIVSRASRV